MQYASYEESFDEKASPNERHKYHFKSMDCPINGPRCVRNEVITVFGADLFNYQSGQIRYIQDAFPYLTPAQRERFLTGICESCFDTM